MATLKRVYSGARWEEKIGYCRAIRSGDHIYVTGCASIGDLGESVGTGNAYLQAKRCLEIVDKAVTDLGATREDIVRTRMFVTDIDRWADFGKAHREFFGENRPATTMVEVSRLIDANMMIEIEADAHVIS